MSFKNMKDLFSSAYFHLGLGCAFVYHKEEVVRFSLSLRCPLKCTPALESGDFTSKLNNASIYSVISRFVPRDALLNKSEVKKTSDMLLYRSFCLILTNACGSSSPIITQYRLAT